MKRLLSPQFAMENNIKPSARKTHRKTRTGCRTCKQRKIKCDEQRPSCNNCVKHSVQCDFLLSQGMGQPGVVTGVSSNSGTPHDTSNAGTPNHQRTSSGSQNNALPNLNLLDLELLHNYVVSTASTLHTDPAMKVVWKINVAQLGFTHDYVMRGILALSALHMAFYKPDQREFYIQQAMMQHQAGLRMATSVLQNITAENCTAVYTFSALTLFFTLGSPRKPGDFLIVGDNGIADWFLLVKGTMYIIDTSESTLLNGPVGPMFLAGRRRMQLREEAIAQQTFEEDPLQEICVLIQQTVQDPHSKEVYMRAITDLRCSFVFLTTPSPSGYETGDIFNWVFRVTDEYLQYLRDHTQEALSIFGFFCVILKRLDSHWWMQGWSTHLISKIYNLLDEEHRLWIRWPVEEIGWIPS